MPSVPGGHPTFNDCKSSAQDDDTLDSFYFRFSPSSFDEVASAVKSKYPALVCKDSVVTNARGGAFTQTECSLSDQQSSLLIQRYAGEITTSSLSLNSVRLLNEFQEKSNARKKHL